jgi:UV DNA damage endonuclease
MRLGYCCINLSLRDKGITGNRGMIKKTWQERGTKYAGELAELNLRDIHSILEWNLKNDIFVYRMSSDIFPWMSEYRFEDLSNFPQLLKIMEGIGDFVKSNNLRISFHPGQFDVLASPNENVVTKTIYDLDQHSRIMDFMGLSANYSSPINIHVGGTYGDKESALFRFCANFNKLAESTKSRLVVENDDKATQFGVLDLFHGIYEKVGCPITFDHFHHRFCTNEISPKDAAFLASTTWGKFTPLQHYSSSKALYEDASVINRSHADYIYEKIPSYGIFADVEIEAKAKDLALIKYRKDSLEIQNFSPKYFKFEENLVI